MQAAQDAADGSATEMQHLGDVHAGPTQTTQDLNELGKEFMRPSRGMARSRGSVAQARTTLFLVTPNPLASGMSIDLELGCHRVQGLLVFEDSEGKLLSTKQGKSGILMEVHSVVS